MEKTGSTFSREMRKNNYMNDAKKAADIVDKGIRKGDFSNMNHKLEELVGEKEVREQYVFSRPTISWYIGMVAL